MKSTAYMIALLLAAPLTAAAQTPAADPLGPVDRVLAHEEDLSLTREQVKKLEGIDRKFDLKDQRLIEKVEALRGRPLGVPLSVRDMSAEDREKLMANRAELQPLMQQLRSSHDAAISEMRSVLTPDQVTRANAYLYQGAGQGGVRANRQRGGMMNQRGGVNQRGGMMEQRRGRRGGW